MTANEDKEGKIVKSKFNIIKKRNNTKTSRSHGGTPNNTCAPVQTPWGLSRPEIQHKNTF